MSVQCCPAAAVCPTSVLSTHGTRRAIPTVSRGSTHPCRFLRHCLIGNSILFKISERIYKVKKFPKVSHSIHHSPPLKSPVVIIQSPLLPLSCGLYYLLLWLCCSRHDVKGGWVFGENKKINPGGEACFVRLTLGGWAYYFSLSLLFSWFFLCQ